MSQSLLSITEVGEKTGLPSSALRYYEKEGLIRSAGRAGGRRQYEAGVLQRLAVIALLQDVGFTIAEISELIARNQTSAWRDLAAGKLQEIDAHLERVAAARELLQAALACGCSSLESCDLVAARRGRHRKVAQTLTLRMGPPLPTPDGS
ncbi:MAG TPA: MerR family transcriptional regulator [Actinomycetota bacterium]|nr:MerR family transcriptional regulator [Actinomycetota bacterium]